MATADHGEIHTPDGAERGVDEERSAPSLAAGCLSITQSNSSHCYPNLTGVASEDWLEWNIGLEWPDGVLEELARRFEAAKEQCQAAKRAHVAVKLPNGRTVSIRRQGSSKGGARGTHFEFFLDVQGVSLLLANRREATRTLPNCRAVVTGDTCLLIGPDRSRQLVDETVDLLGAEADWTSVSRIDICLDLPDVPISAFDELIVAGQFVGRGRTSGRQEDGGRVTGLTFGKAPCRVTIYDKFRERLGKCEPDVNAALVEKRWNGDWPTSRAASRVEFQLRRDWLRMHGVDSLEDYDRLRGSLVENLVTERLRLTTAPIDRKNKHQSRAKTHPLWESVQSLLMAWAGSPNGPLEPLPRLEAQPERLPKQAVGLFRTYALRTRRKFESLDDFYFFMGECLYRIVDDEAWLEEYRHELERLPRLWEDAA